MAKTPRCDSSITLHIQFQLNNKNSSDIPPTANQGNVQVQLGLIDKLLEFVLQEPPHQKKAKTKRKSTYTDARIITNEIPVTISHDIFKHACISTAPIILNESQTQCEVKYVGVVQMSYHGLDVIFVRDGCIMSVFLIRNRFYLICLL